MVYALPDHIRRMLHGVKKVKYFHDTKDGTVHVLYCGDSVGYFTDGTFRIVEYDEQSKQGMRRRKLGIILGLQERIKLALAKHPQENLEDRAN